MIVFGIGKAHHSNQGGMVVSWAESGMCPPKRNSGQVLQALGPFAHVQLRETSSANLLMRQHWPKALQFRGLGSRQKRGAELADLRSLPVQVRLRIAAIA